MQEYYKVLNISEDATDQEIENAYQKLKTKYARDRFLEGEVGNEAARKLTLVENAYKEIMESRKNFSNSQDEKVEDFSRIEQLIKDGKINEAQVELDSLTVRTAEWHYIQSVIFYKKNWNNESKKQLEIAMNLDPNNSKYSSAYQKLKAKIENNQRVFHSGNAGYGEDPNNSRDRQMGNSSNECAETCMTLCCLNMMCNSCCR